MSLTKKQIIEKLKDVKYFTDHILNEKIDAFEDALIDERQSEDFDYGYIGYLGNEVYMAQQLHKTIFEIIGEEDGD